MNPENVTIITAVDREYLPKFLAVYETWAKNKPEILKMPMVVMYDSDQLAAPHVVARTERAVLWKADSLRNQLGHQNVRFEPWTGEYATQREKMLTSLVFGAVEQVRTPWYLKIDADTLATAPGKWIRPVWFRKKDGHRPAFVTNPWGYTKPASVIADLEDWGDTVEAFKGTKRLNYKPEADGSRVYHPRIISWLYFGNTEWTRWAVSLLKGRKLPVPSQDTYLWYCAARMGHHFVTTKFGKYGWGHMGRRATDKIVQACKDAIE